MFLEIIITRMYDKLPACTWQVLKNQYFEPTPRFLVLFCFPQSCINDDRGYDAFQENEKHGCLDLCHGY